MIGKKNRKKILLLQLLVLTAFVMNGCGKGNGGNKSMGSDEPITENTAILYNS